MTTKVMAKAFSNYTAFIGWRLYNNNCRFVGTIVGLEDYDGVLCFKTTDSTLGCYWQCSKVELGLIHLLEENL